MSAEARLDRAHGAFLAVLEAGMQPTMTANVQTGNNWRDGEYDVLVEGLSHHGILQEEIEQSLEIAKAHDGRLFLLGAGEDKGKLAILFPYERTPGPEGEEGESPADKTRRASRRKPKAKP